MKTELNLPASYRKNIRQAVAILKNSGCTEVFLFGSLASGMVRENSDIDLAIRGCPKGRFFSLLGELLVDLDYPVDLVNLDYQNDFTHYLEKEQELIKID